MPVWRSVSQTEATSWRTAAWYSRTPARSFAKTLPSGLRIWGARPRELGGGDDGPSRAELHAENRPLGLLGRDATAYLDDPVRRRGRRPHALGAAPTRYAPPGGPPARAARTPGDHGVGDADARPSHPDRARLHRVGRTGKRASGRRLGRQAPAGLGAEYDYAPQGHASR